MSTKSILAFKIKIPAQSIGLLQNQVAVSNAFLCVSLCIHKELLTENKKLKIQLASNEEPSKIFEIKTLNEKIGKLSSRCKAFQSSAIQLAAQLNNSSQLNKILKEKTEKIKLELEKIKLELEKERGFRAKLSKQCKRLDQHIIHLTRKNKEESIKFIPDYFGESSSADNDYSIGRPIAIHHEKMINSNDINIWKKYQIQIENLKKQKIQADEKRFAAEDKLSRIQNDFFLQTMH